ncbi:alpha/beta fold hydrolase [Caldalkalibacillus mannanilyticus]|uniref:alpha/beta fold hydrolase n=1 Tax=Caldalkalibacillus mannanilyticus TaxID=1418 RepID=UPI00046980E2|nr:alpha/beta fold hydrolase [Caldalkalibacillus mannanilyticus]
MIETVKQVKKLIFNSATISYYMIGDRKKETIVMLHPAFADHQIFEPQIEHFKHNYQIILIDMPGHGKTQVAGSKVTLRDMPEILDQLLAENDIPSCHLVGVSLGSLIAQAFAENYPNRVKSVMIVGGYSIHKANERVLKAQKKEGLKWIFYTLLSMNKFKRYIISGSCHTDQGRDLFSKGVEHFTKKSFSAMAGMNRFFTKKAKPMPYPLLLVIGEHDLPLIQEATMELHKLEPHSQRLVLAGAGHCANVDAPLEFNQIAERFLSDCDL